MNPSPPCSPPHVASLHFSYQFGSLVQKNGFGRVLEGRSSSSESFLSHFPSTVGASREEHQAWSWVPPCKPWRATTAACALVPSALVEWRAATSPPSSSALAQASISRQRRPWKSTAYCCKIARNVIAMAVGDATAEVSTVAVKDAPAELVTLPAGDAPAQASTEMPEIVKNIIDTWDKIEDKYAVTSIGVAGIIALWGAAGMISAIDKLPLVPGALKLVGIGYTGWFAYQNLIFKPDREAFIAKIKSTYKEIIGSS